MEAKIHIIIFISKLLGLFIRWFETFWVPLSCVSFDTHDLNNKIMPRATGPIGYVEHRSPRKDENGKYIIHPQFVQKEMYDAEKMAHDSQGRCMTNGAHIPTALVVRRYPL